MSSSARGGDASQWIEPPADGVTFAARMRATAAVMADLEAYRLALVEWSGRANLVGPSALAEFWPRHVFDSAQIRLIAPAARRFIDIGAGAGFPGLVLAILLKAEGGHVDLIESQGKRCDFLTSVVKQLQLPATVHRARAEAGPRLEADVVTARACAPLSRLLGFSARYLTPTSRGLFLKGRNVDLELAEACKLWRFDSALIPSLSHPDGRIVSIARLSRA